MIWEGSRRKGPQTHDRHLPGSKMEERIDTKVRPKTEDESARLDAARCWGIQKDLMFALVAATKTSAVTSFVLPFLASITPKPRIPVPGSIPIILIYISIGYLTR